MRCSSRSANCRGNFVIRPTIPGMLVLSRSGRACAIWIWHMGSKWTDGYYHRILELSVIPSQNWSRREELNAPSAEYDSAALALSYTGLVKIAWNYTFSLAH